jgi:hypothetical protein
MDANCSWQVFCELDAKPREVSPLDLSPRLSVSLTILPLHLWPCLHCSFAHPLSRFASRDASGFGASDLLCRRIDQFGADCEFFLCCHHLPSCSAPSNSLRLSWSRVKSHVCALGSARSPARRPMRLLLPFLSLSTSSTSSRSSSRSSYKCRSR